MEERVEFGECYAVFAGGELTLGNAQIERRWRVENGLLYAVSFRDRSTGREWLARPSSQPALLPAVPFAGETREVRFAARAGRFQPTEAPSLVAAVTVVGRARTLVYRFQLFAGARGVALQLVDERGENTVAPGAAAASEAAEPSGVEGGQPAKTGEGTPVDVLEHLELSARHLRLLQVTLRDQTDIRNELVSESEWLLHPSEAKLVLEGNLFILEETLTHEGLILLKHAPLPHARPVKDAVDLRANGNTSVFSLCGHGMGPEGGEGYRCVVLAYSGGRAGRTAALQEYQRQLREYQPGRDGLLLSNTWGDRSRDSRISEAFLRQEIDAGARLGVDVVQIDDGWQTGSTANSAQGGGVWEGFWSASDAFWEPHPERFPNGLAPVVAEARARGMQFGLWFAPDSADDFANWERDAARLLDLHRTLGVNYFKIDSVQMRSKTGERNLHRFFDRMLRESEGKIVFDLDVTAAIRPGYFSLMQIGTLFVENRYTDWRRYYPHQTLRNLWKLAHYLDPIRLRMEFLNHARNQHLYENDPLAPICYSPAYLFATVMFGSPLGWFEVSNLPEGYIEAVAPLVQVWQAHRERLHRGRLFPIGETPDGTAWTGFASVAEDGRSGYLLLFRELNERPECRLEVPLLAPGAFGCEVLAGEGTVSLAEDGVHAALPDPRCFLFARFQAA